MDHASINYSRKIRIYPNNEQLQFFNKCFGCSRYIYNKGVEYINNLYKSKLKKFKQMNKQGCIFVNKNTQCCNQTTDNNYFCPKHKNKKLNWEIPLSLIKLRPLVMKNNSELSVDEQWQTKQVLFLAKK